MLFAGILLWRAFLYKNEHLQNQSIVTEFSAPDGIDAIMCGVLRDGRINSEDITAGIITLAQKGILSIVRVENGNHVDCKICYEQNLSIDDNDSYYNELLNLLFLSPVPGETVMLSSITENKNIKLRNFYITRRLKNKLNLKLVQLGYFEELPMDAMFKGAIIGLLFALLTLFLMFVLLGSYIIFSSSETVLIKLNFAIVSIVFIAPLIDMSVRWRRLTLKGAISKNKLAGFRQYLSVAENDRYESEVLLTNNVLSWREHLPYAVAFGLVTQWNDLFSSIRSFRDENGRF
jgi:hypothetical protein